MELMDNNIYPSKLINLYVSPYSLSLSQIPAIFSKKLLLTLSNEVEIILTLPFLNCSYILYCGILLVIYLFKILYSIFLICSTISL